MGEGKGASQPCFVSVTLGLGLRENKKFSQKRKSQKKPCMKKNRKTEPNVFRKNDTIQRFMRRVI